MDDELRAGEEEIRRLARLETEIFNADNRVDSEKLHELLEGVHQVLSFSASAQQLALQYLEDAIMQTEAARTEEGAG